MKHFLILSAVVFITLISFSSCKKAYRCVCQDGVVVNSYEDKLNKSDADAEKANCEFTPGCVFERDKN